MTQSARLLSGALLALTLASGCAVATESLPAFDVAQTSVTGSFLAGRQAMNDLRTEDAARYFRGAAEADWENPIVIERAFIAYAANGQIEDSALTARHLLELQPANDLAKLVIGSEALKQRRYGAVEKELESVGGDTFAGITAGILRGWAFAGDGKLDEAYKTLDKIGEGGLEDFLVFHRALMADVAGRPAEALDFAKRSWEADPFVARIVEAYARMLGNAGRFDEASTVIAKFEDEGLNHPLITDVKRAIDNKQRPGIFAADVQSGAAEMFHSVGVAMAREGSPDVAAVFLRLGMYLDPRADVIDLVYGQLLDDSGQHDAANAIYDTVPVGSPMKPAAVVRVAENLNALGNRDEALRRLGNIVSTTPDDLDALSVLGDLQRSAELFGEAAETYSKALDLAGGDAPGDWRFYYVRGIAYDRDQQWSKAESDFKKALELNPDQPQVLNYLGYSWVDKGINLMPALEMIEKAVAAAPNDGYIIDSLGWAYYRLGRFGEAVTELEKAAQMRSTDPEINDHLGDAYWRAGRKLEARFQWNVAAAVDEDGDVKARVAKKLAEGLAPLEAVSAEGPAVEGEKTVTQ